MAELLVFRSRQVEAMRALVARCGDQRPLALNADTDILLGDYPERLRFIRYADALSSERQTEVGEASLRLAQNWYIVRDHDPTIVTGVSFGRYIDYEIKRALTVVCRQIAVLRELAPSRILVADDGSLVSRTTLAYAAAHGIPVEVVAAQAVSIAEWQVPRAVIPSSSLKARLKDYLLGGHWIPRGGSSSSVFVFPHPYMRTLIEAVLATEQRVVLPTVDTRYRWHRRVVTADWRTSPQPATADLQRESSWENLDSARTAETLSYEGVSLWPLLRPIARAFWDGAWVSFQHQVWYYRRRFDELQVRAVVVPQDQSGLPKIAVLLARQNGAVSVCVEHGIAGDRPPGFPRNNADLLAVYGEECRSRILSVSGADDIATVGNDYLGMPAAMIHADRDTARQRLGIPKSAGNVVLFAAGVSVNLSVSDDPSNANEALAAACRAAASIPEAIVVVRLHPSTRAYESVDTKHEIVAKLNPGNIILDSGVQAAEALAASDVVITVDSTIGIDAIAAGKPLVVFDPLRTDSVGYVRGDAGPAAHDEFELASTLATLLSVPAAFDAAREAGQRFLRERVLHFTDGNAGRRLLHEIERRETRTSARAAKSV